MIRKIMVRTDGTIVQISLSDTYTDECVTKQTYVPLLKA